MITAPLSDAWVIMRRCPVCSGVSRTSNTRRRRSFSVTSAARLSRLPVLQVATSDSVLIEPGNAFFARRAPDASHYRLAYSSIDPGRIRQGLELVAERLDEAAT